MHYSSQTSRFLFFKQPNCYSISPLSRLATTELVSASSPNFADVGPIPDRSCPRLLNLASSSPIRLSVANPNLILPWIPRPHSKSPERIRSRWPWPRQHHQTSSPIHIIFDLGILNSLQVRFWLRFSTESDLNPLAALSNPINRTCIQLRPTRLQ